MIRAILGARLRPASPIALPTQAVPTQTFCSRHPPRERGVVRAGRAIFSTNRAESHASLRASRGAVLRLRVSRHDTSHATSCQHGHGQL